MRTGTGKADPRLWGKQGSVRLADKKFPVLREESPRHPVQCAAIVRAAIDVGMQPAAKTDGKPFFANTAHA